MPHQYCNTIPSSISVSLPPSRPLSLLPSFHTGTIARTMPGCHHIKHQRQRERERERESEGQRERERGTDEERDTELQCGSKSDCASKQNWGEKLPLKLIIYPWEEKPQCLSVSMCCSLSLCLCLSLGANCLHATSVYFYTLLSKPLLQDQIQLSIRVFHLSFSLFSSTFSLHCIYWQHTVYQWQFSDSASKWPD